MRIILFILLVISGIASHGIGAHASINVCSMPCSSKERNILTEVSESSQMSKDKNYVILRRNKSFEKQIADNPNTIFEIRYTFNLKNKTVSIPANCILKFNGGKLKNGEVVGNNTTIESDVYTIFQNVNIRGVWSNRDSYIGWIATNNYDKYSLLKSAFVLGKNVHFLPQAVYYVNIPKRTSDLINPSNHTMIGNDATLLVDGGETQCNLFYIDENSNNFTLNIYDLNIIGKGQYYVNNGDKWMCNDNRNAFYTSNVIGFHIVGRGDVSIKNCSFSNLLYGIRMDESRSLKVKRNFKMENCNSDEKCIMPVMVHHVNNTEISNCSLTCAKSTPLIHHLYIADGIDTILVENCYLYGGTGDPLDIYHSHCKTQIIRNNRIIADAYSAIVLDDVDKDVLIDSCYLYATGRGCLYGYDCMGTIIGRNTVLETPVSRDESGHYIIHSPYHQTPLRIQFKDCSLKSNSLHSATSAELIIEMDRCEMQFLSNATISRPVSRVEYIIRNSSIKCPNFTRYSTLFDVRNEKSSVNIVNTSIERGDEGGDWLVYVDVPYKLTLENCTCNNVKAIIEKKHVKARISSRNSRIISLKQ